MRGWLRWLTLGGLLAGAVLTVQQWRRGRRAGEAPFGRARIVMNARIDPWLMQHGFAGGQHSEIGIIEHMGRKTGSAHTTPVYPTLIENRVWIPLPYGAASQWARNVIAAGYCQLHLQQTVYGLDEPQIVPASEYPKLPPMAARLADWLGIEYLRLHRFAERPEALAIEAPATPLDDHEPDYQVVATTVVA